MHRILALSASMLLALSTMTANGLARTDPGQANVSPVSVRTSLARTAATAAVMAPNWHRGWTGEQLLGSTRNDDWEPAVATDPAAPYVYILTTRYSGKKACSTCPDPALILKVSKDGGRSFGADQFLCPCPGISRSERPPDLGRPGRDRLRGLAQRLRPRRRLLEVERPRPLMDQAHRSEDAGDLVRG